MLLSEKVNAANGALTVADRKTLSGVCARAVVVDPSGKNVYVAMGDATDNLGAIQGFAIGTDGALNELPGSPFQLNGFPTGMAMHSSGNFIYAASNAGVLVLDRNPSTGFVSERGAFNTPKNRLALNPAGTFLVASEVDGSAISQFHVDPNTGDIEAIDFRPHASLPYGVASDPQGNFFAVTETVDSTSSAGAVSTFLLDNSTHELIETSGSPFPAGHGTIDLGFDPSGAYLYAVNRQDGSVSGFVLDRSSGALTAIQDSPFSTAGDFPDGIVVVKPQ